MRILKVSIISEHGNIESCSLLKKNNVEEFIEQNIPELEGDEDKTKGSFSFNLSPPIVIAHPVHEAYELEFHPRVVYSVFKQKR